MTPGQRLVRARRRLVATVALAAVGWAICGGIAVLVILRALGMSAATPVAVAAAVAVFLLLGWRHRALGSLQSLALWIEEDNPQADFALVTVTDPRLAGGGATGLIEAAGAVDIEGRASAAMHRLVVRALTACGLAGALWFAVGRTMGVGTAPDSAATGPREIPNRLVPLTARVTPPAYSHLPARSLTEPSGVEGLVGSEIVLSGSGDPAGVSADTSSGPLPITSADGRWTTHLRMPPLPAVVKLRDRNFSRLLVLAPRTDSIPEVVLDQPLHDTTYKTVPPSAIVLEAHATDDFGLAAGYFEYLITVGGGESFTTTARTGPRRPLSGRTATLRGSIRLDTLKLTPGSVISIRAVVFDGNDVTGPGKGLSETRTLRLAERQDSTSVNAAPPDQVDSMLISQRLLNMKTDSLIRARPKLAKAAYADRSMTHSNTQETIRQRVLTVIGVLEDDGVGGTAPTDISQLLRSAAEEMGSARIELALSRPPVAMPHMKKALAILDQVRLSNRYYLRGRQPAVLVDIDKVRLKGEVTPTPASRLPRTRLADALAALSLRIESAAALYHVTPAESVDSLTLVRVAALSLAPAIGQQLGIAIEQLAHDAPLDSALAAVRRALAPAPQLLTGPVEWSGAPTR